MMNSATILVVEDQPMLLQNIVSILNLHGFTTLQATNGADGLTIAINSLPSLIVSDVMMEGMDGFQLLSNLKANLLTQHIPFVFLTARADIIDKNTGIAAGALAYLTKPFSGKELVDTIRQLL